MALRISAVWLCKIAALGAGYNAFAAKDAFRGLDLGASVRIADGFYGAVADAFIAVMTFNIPQFDNVIHVNLRLYINF